MFQNRRDAKNSGAALSGQHVCVAVAVVSSVSYNLYIWCDLVLLNLFFIYCHA